MNIRHLPIFAFLALQVTTVFGGEYSESIRVGSETVTVTIKTEETTNIKPIDGKPWKLEEGFAIGGWPAEPINRITHFSVKWGQKVREMPKELYNDIFNALLKSKRGWWDDGGIIIRKSNDESYILVELESSHVACCGYTIYWSITNEGKFSRVVDNSAP